MHPYRPVAKPIDYRWLRARGDWRRFVCLFIGHRWVPLSLDGQRANVLVHLYTRAGWEEQCARCGRHEDDRSIAARIALDGGM